MPSSVLEAIRQGIWDYEPGRSEEEEFGRTEAMPGSTAKLDILADRVESGLPLWHPSDRLCFDDVE